jgi:hypothetical protein
MSFSQHLLPQDDTEVGFAVSPIKRVTSPSRSSLPVPAKTLECNEKSDAGSRRTPQPRTAVVSPVRGGDAHLRSSPASKRSLQMTTPPRSSGGNLEDGESAAAKREGSRLQGEARYALAHFFRNITIICAPPPPSLSDVVCMSVGVLCHVLKRLHS